QHERLYWRPLFIGGLAASIAWTCFVLFGGVFVALRWQILSYSLTLFASCMVCHGELVRLRPRARHLTSFYLMVAGGGTLGGLLVTVAAPHLFKGFWEYHFGLLATVLLALIVLFRDRKSPLYQGRPLIIWAIWAVICVSWAVLGFMLDHQIWRSWRFQLGLLAVALATLGVLLHERNGRHYQGRPARVWAVWAALCVSWLALGLVLRIHIRQSLESSVETRRNFFGVLRVLELNKVDPAEHRLTLMHGRIEHGFQYQEVGKRYWPTSYYGADSGIGLALRLHPRRLERQDLRIGVVGLGTGTLAAYGQPGDYIRFYEINPEVLQLSDKYFTYRRDSLARIEVVLGDARVTMERERQRGEPQRFDVLAVDAFSSDAIPVHLLTRECFQTYRYHLKEDGILAIHISNRYFDLSPVVRNLIRPGPQQDMQALYIDGLGNASRGTDATDWVLLTANQQFLANPDFQKEVSPWKDPAPPQQLWTDDYSNLFSLLRERKSSSQ
ncbi:MAG: fused MFS/spermidine synthase, partial [Acidobacteriia bacterium]|nr:fused MFS/spermidine synthase [Terriglobia bacterium]